MALPRNRPLHTAATQDVQPEAGFRVCRAFNVFSCFFKFLKFIGLRVYGGYTKELEMEESLHHPIYLLPAEFTLLQGFGASLLVS